MKGKKINKSNLKILAGILLGLILFSSPLSNSLDNPKNDEPANLPYKSTLNADNDIVPDGIENSNDNNSLI